MIKYLLTYDMKTYLKSWMGYLKDYFLYLIGKKARRSYRLFGLLTPYEYGKMSSHSCNCLLKDVKQILRKSKVKNTSTFESIYRYEDVGLGFEMFNMLR
jgi:hypothetical protein